MVVGIVAVVAFLVGAVAGAIFIFRKLVLGKALERLEERIAADQSSGFQLGRRRAFQMVHHQVEHHGLAGAALLAWLDEADADVVAEMHATGEAHGDAIYHEDHPA